MTTITHRLLWAGLSFALFMFPAFAGVQTLVAQERKTEKEKSSDELFQQLDKNGDGKITADEVGDDQRKFFDRLLRVADKDKNGELSKAEFAEGFKPDEIRQGTNQEFGEGRREGGNFDPAQMFERMDANKDGKVTLDEVPEPRREGFQGMLKALGRDDKAGISKDEFVKFVGARRRDGGAAPGRPGGEAPDPEKMFQQFDKNNDGKLSLAEVPEPLKRPLERMLAESGQPADGAVSKDVFVKMMRQFQERRREGQPPPADGTKPREGMREGGRPLPPPLFRRLDTNNDGTLDKAELAKVVDLFDELDRNHDGKLDVAELIGPPPGPDGAGRRPADAPPGDRKSDDRKPGEEKPAGERRK